MDLCRALQNNAYLAIIVYRQQGIVRRVALHTDYTTDRLEIGSTTRQLFEDRRIHFQALFLPCIALTQRTLCAEELTRHSKPTSTDISAVLESARNALVHAWLMPARAVL